VEKAEPFFSRRQRVIDLRNESVATFRCVGRTNERRMGSIVWAFRCKLCDQERLWTAMNVRTFKKKHGFRCECQGGSPRARTGRSPARLEPTSLEEKGVDDLTPDELEAATLAEFESDRSLPRLRPSDVEGQEAFA